MDAAGCAFAGRPARRDRPTRSRIPRRCPRQERRASAPDRDRSPPPPKCPQRASTFAPSFSDVAPHGGALMRSQVAGAVQRLVSADGWTTCKDGGGGAASAASSPHWSEDEIVELANTKATMSCPIYVPRPMPPSRRRPRRPAPPLDRDLLRRSRPILSWRKTAAR